MLICPRKRDWVRYIITKYIFIGYNSRIKVTISTIEVMKISSLKDYYDTLKKRLFDKTSKWIGVLLLNM